MSLPKTLRRQEQMQWNRSGRWPCGHHLYHRRVGTKLPGQDGGNRRQAIGALAVPHSAAGALFNIVKTRRSLADGVGQILAEYLRESKEMMQEMIASTPAEAEADHVRQLEEYRNNGGQEVEKAHAMTSPPRIGDLCPECGEAAVVNEEGCRKCYACSFSEC